MKARCRTLADNSLSAALSAIEIYNKPDFRHREQIFSVLMIVAWESLFKAKILKDNDNRMSSIYERNGRRVKYNRTGHPLTIGIFSAMQRCDISPVVAENIERLVEVRDAAVHLTTHSSGLPYLVFILGAASLRNYAKLVRDWFNIGLSDYNFYILPLGFEYPFKTLSLVELKKEVEDIALIMSAVAKAQVDGLSQDEDFSLVCELRTTLISAKKITEETDLIAKLDGLGDKGSAVISREVSLIDKYPFTYTQVLQRLKDIDQSIKPNQLNHLITTKKIKQDAKYARYNYRSKSDEKRGPKTTTAVLYNHSFFQLASAELCRTNSPKRQKLQQIKRN